MKPKYLSQGSAIIERLAASILIKDANAFKNSEWRKGGEQYKLLLYYARKILQEGSFYSIQGLGEGGMGGQLITVGYMKTLGKPGINKEDILEKAVDSIYKQLKEKEPSDNEREQIIKDFFKDQHNPQFQKRYSNLQNFYNGLDKGEIRRRLWDKYDAYLERKSQKIKLIST